MKKAQIKVGGLYTARISGRYVTVRVDAIREGTSFNRDCTLYDITNLNTGRKTTFRSAAKFRSEVKKQEFLETVKKADEFAMKAVNEGRIKVEETMPDGSPVPEAEHRSDPTRLRVGTDGVMSAANTEHSDGCPTGVGGANDADKGEQSKWCECGGSFYEESYDAKGNEVCRQCGLPWPPDREAIDRVNEIEAQNLERNPLHYGSPNPNAVEDNTENDCSDPTASTATATSTSTPPSSQEGAAAPLAANIAASRTSGREVGSLVAGMTPNEEQEGILAIAVEQGLRVLVVGAGAGTGKTATLKMLEQTLPGKGQYTAFNSSLVAEGKAKFQKAACNTTHSLAFREVGRLYQHRLGGERMKSYQIARILGIEDFPVTLKGQGEPDENGTPTDKVKVLRAEFLAGQVLVAIRKFCQSADDGITERHLRYIDGIDADHGHENNDRVKEYLLPFCQKAWADLTKVDGQLPFSHDCYVKLWQLGRGQDRPVIAADYILLDEAQDTAPVFLDILRQQEHALLIFVGDSNQAIYEWRGAVDAMKAYPDAERRLLSQSYRFGQAIADVANTVLGTLEEPTDLIMRGNPAIPSRVAEVAEPRCYLYRTNAGAVSRVMTARGQGKHPHLIGGGKDVVDWCQAAVDLQANRGTRHPELCCFETWAEVVEYSESDEGGDIKLMVKLIEEFGAANIRDALKDMPPEDRADLVVSTAHKSKGREWETVKLGPDFPTVKRMNDPDRRLLYVAATRAKEVLDITECPPFCGGDEKAWGEAGAETRWVPGLDIRYTQPMPTEDDLAAYREGRTPPQQDASQLFADNQPGGNPPPKPTERKQQVSVTYAKLRSGEWGLRSTTEIKTGQVVTVTTKAGERKTETVGQIVWSGNGVWLAAKGGNGGRSNGGGNRNERVCAECGKPGYLREDLEDGLMKHPKCCDM